MQPHFGGGIDSIPATAEEDSCRARQMSPSAGEAVVAQDVVQRLQHSDTRTWLTGFCPIRNGLTLGSGYHWVKGTLVDRLEVLVVGVVALFHSLGIGTRLGCTHYGQCQFEDSIFGPLGISNVFQDLAQRRELVRFHVLCNSVLLIRC